MQHFLISHFYFQLVLLNNFPQLHLFHNLLTQMRQRKRKENGLKQRRKCLSTAKRKRHLALKTALSKFPFPQGWGKGTEHITFSSPLEVLYTLGSSCILHPPSLHPIQTIPFRVPASGTRSYELVFTQASFKNQQKLRVLVFLSPVLFSLRFFSINY